MSTCDSRNQELMSRTQLLVNSTRMEHRLKREEVLLLYQEKLRA
jgi:hypothetical protein